MVSEQTQEEDERLREELRHVDLEKLKKVIKPLISTKALRKPQTERTTSRQK
jgi:hypothetical protein